MTTEHFTLQTARGLVNAEISARLQLYLDTLSSVIIALALVAQLSELGFAFRAFALVLRPVVSSSGVVTRGRLLQAEAEWQRYGQGRNRIRHYYLEVAPEMARYLVLPASDDPWAGLAAVGIGVRGRAWWPAVAHRPAVIVVINSVLAGVFAGLWRSVAGRLGRCGRPSRLCAHMVILGTYEQRAFRCELAAVPAPSRPIPHVIAHPLTAASRTDAVSPGRLG